MKMIEKHAAKTLIKTGEDAREALYGAESTLNLDSKIAKLYRKTDTVAKRDAIDRGGQNFPQNKFFG